MIEVLQSDVMDFRSDERYHALLCDPPYHLYNDPRGVWRYDVKKGDKVKAKHGGFMGKQWDGGDIAFRPETWAHLAQFLYDGAFGMCFASSRGWHRLACAIEDAGLVIHPTIFCWAFGSGFPKATRIDTQVDKRKGGTGITIEVVKYLRQRRDELGLTNADIDRAFGFNGMAGHWTGFSQPEIPRLAYWKRIKELLQLDDRFDDAITAYEREIIGNSDNGIAGGTHEHVGQAGAWGFNGEYDLTAPATPLARAWAGHRYGLQCLKPAVEPIIVFQKPYRGKPIECITRTGAGALNIDGGRIACSDKAIFPAGIVSDTENNYGDGKGLYDNRPRTGDNNPHGRWAANFIVAHSPACKRVGTKRVKGDKRGAGNGKVQRKAPGQNGIYNDGWNFGEQNTTPMYGDADGMETVEAWQCADDCAVRRLDEQSGISRSIRSMRGNLVDHRGNNFNRANGARIENSDYARGYFDTGGASRFFFNVAQQIDEADPVRYVAKASRRERDAGCEEFEEKEREWADDRTGGKGTGYKERLGGSGKPINGNGQLGKSRNPHPTVKPIALTRYLATLLLPPPEYAPRRILIPFAGVMSEVIGAMQAGWEDITAIEFEPEYVEIGRARIRYWEAKKEDKQNRLF